MPIAMLGLGRMGHNVARRLRRGGHQVAVYARDPVAVATVLSPPYNRWPLMATIGGLSPAI